MGERRAEHRLWLLLAQLFSSNSSVASITHSIRSLEFDQVSQPGHSISPLPTQIYCQSQIAWFLLCNCSRSRIVFRADCVLFD